MLGDILAEAADRWGDRTALTVDDRQFGFRALHLETNRLAHGLIQTAGLQTGDRVVILLDNCWQAVVSYHAVAKAGAIAIPCNTRQTRSELQFMLGDSGTRLVITSTAHLSKIEAIRSSLPALTSVICVDGESEQAISWSACTEGMPERDLPSRVRSDDVAFIAYTSGTTGRPKGAMLTHGGYLANLESIHRAIPFYPSDNVLIMLPHFHIFPLTLGLFYALREGAQIVLTEIGRSFEKLVHLIAQHRITILPAVPPIFHILVSKRIPGVKAALSSLRMAISGGAALTPATWEKFERTFGVPLLEAYGMTEGGPLICINRMEGPRKPGSVGLPIPGVEVDILDPQGRRLPPGEIGEIAVKSPGVLKGYYHHPEATREALRQGWLLTGDMGLRDAEGYVYIVDRKKDVIVVQGINVYPKEIEDVLSRHPAVMEAAVIGEKRGGSEIPVALVTLRPGLTVTGKEILEHCRQHLAPFKVPRRVHIVSELPKTPLGKVQKQELQRVLAGSRD